MARILIAGADGRTGRQVVELARGHGNEVGELASTRDRSAIAHAVRGFDAVVSTLLIDGAGGERDVQDVSADLVRVMVAEGVGRLVVASWAGAGGHRRELGLLRRARSVLAGEDLEVADLVEGDVMLSELDWTIVRVHGVSDRPRTGHYRVVEGPVVPKGSEVPRGDLAAFLLKTAETGRYPKRIVAISR